jgi:hypothetical protein
MRACWMSATGRRSLFGDVIFVLFVATQAADGVFTYVGTSVHGAWLEANPLVVVLIAAFGHGFALTTAKLFASSLGALLHLKGVHYALAALTVFYLVMAIAPWTSILFS